jgi:hypothetical protein
MTASEDPLPRTDPRFSRLEPLPLSEKGDSGSKYSETASRFFASWRATVFTQAFGFVAFLHRPYSMASKTAEKQS